MASYPFASVAVPNYAPADDAVYHLNQDYTPSSLSYALHGQPSNETGPSTSGGAHPGYGYGYALGPNSNYALVNPGPGRRPARPMLRTSASYSHLYNDPHDARRNNPSPLSFMSRSSSSGSPHSAASESFAHDFLPARPPGPIYSPADGYLSEAEMTLFTDVVAASSAGPSTGGGMKDEAFDYALHGAGSYLDLSPGVISGAASSVYAPSHSLAQSLAFSPMHPPDAAVLAAVGAPAQGRGQGQGYAGFVDPRAAFAEPQSYYSDAPRALAGTPLQHAPPMRFVHPADLSSPSPSSRDAPSPVSSVDPRSGCLGAVVDPAHLSGVPSELADGDAEGDVDGQLVVKDEPAAAPEGLLQASGESEASSDEEEGEEEEEDDSDGSEYHDDGSADGDFVIGKRRTTSRAQRGPSSKRRRTSASASSSGVSSSPSRLLAVESTFESASRRARHEKVMEQMPVPVPHLTKKSRGRRVPTAPVYVEDKNARPYACTVDACGKRFARGEHLKRHIRSIHTHEKPYECKHCGKGFSRFDNLRQHSNIHRRY